MNTDAPTLEVGFAIDTGGAFAELLRFSQMFDESTLRVVQDAAAIERATGGMLRLSAATAEISSFGNAATSKLRDVARETAKVESAGERLSAQLARQTSAFGKTREELRGVKAETAALAAEQQGLAELAGRLRSQEAALVAAELAAQERIRQEIAAVAQAKEQAAALAVAGAEREAQARREAGLAYQMFEARARQGVAVMREQQAAEQAAVRAQEALATSGERLRASIDPAYAAQQRFNREMLEARTLISGGAISLDDYVAKLRIERAALSESSEAHARNGTSAGANRAAMAGLSYQVQDTFTQLSMGANAFQVVAIQGGQAAGQFAFVQGKAGDLARFMIGPWGLAITGAALVLGPLIGKLLNTNSAMDDSIAKLKKDAVETETNRVAKARFALSAEGVAAATREQAAALKTSSEQLHTSAERANIAAQQNMLHALSIRAQTAAMLEQAIAQETIDRQRSAGPGQRGELGTLALTESSGRVSGLQARLSANQVAIDQQNKVLNGTRVQLAIEQSKLDAAGKINKAYDARVIALQAEKNAAIARGETIGAASQREFAGIERNRQAALKAEQDKQSATRQTANQIGRNVTLMQAREIAESAGGRVTSDHRSFAKQQALYAKYKAGGNLAAKPGTSYHELDQALDVAKSSGMTLKKLVGAYRAAGVTLVEALDEGDHYHVAWKKVGEAARQQSAEQTAAQKEAVEAAATGAQVDNLYLLAGAYAVTGGEALIAAAKLKAESSAIRSSGDVDAAVARQVRVAVAQRVADASQATASMNQQAIAQEAANATVTAGLVPAERAAELLRDRMADLPLLAAIEAAQKVKDKVGIDAATKALDDQRAARVRLQAAEVTRQFNDDTASGNNQLVTMREELRLIGATDAARVHALATVRATQEAQAKGFDPAQTSTYIAQQVRIADGQQALTTAQAHYNDALGYTATLFDAIHQSAQTAGQGIADAFGQAGSAIGDALTTMTGYYAEQARLGDEHRAAIKVAGADEAAIARANGLYAVRSATLQVNAYGDIAKAAKGLFKQHSAGYKAMEGVEKVFRAIQLALAIKTALTQIGLIGGQVAAKVVGDTTMAVSDTARAGVEQSNSFATTAVKAVEAVVNAIKSLPFPLNLVAGAATAAAIATLGVSIAGGFGGGRNTLPKANEGTGTVLGDPTAKSDSLKRSIDALKDVDTLTNSYSRQMAASLKSIDSQIGGVAAVIARGGDISASAGVKTGFQPNIVGSVLKAIPLVGGFLSSLFGSSTTVTGGGLYGKSQTLGSVLNGGFAAQTYSDVEKKSKFFGITTGTSHSTQYGAADPTLGNQFTLILKQFNAAIVAAAGPLGASTGEIQSRLNGFVVDIGKIDLKGLTGAQVQEKLSNIFGAAADKMADAAFPGLQRFQKVGEGAFETLVRVSSTVEQVTTALGLLGSGARALGIDAKLALADQFASIGDLTSAADGYFQAYYSKQEQAAAKTAQLTGVFGSLELAMPATLAAFRGLVEAQDLTTAAGQSTYATLLKLAPAFADLQSSLEGAKSAADIAGERADLQRQILELQGNTAAIRALDLAKIDPANRALQQQIYAIKDAQDAAKAADELRKAWSSVGDSIETEIKRIRGLGTAGTDGNFAALQGQFNAASASARGGDQDAAKSLPGLSQALLTAAAQIATSRQELNRVQAQTAASLEATYGAIGALTARPQTTSTADQVTAAANASQGASTPSPANDDLISEIKSLRDEVSQLRSENNSGHAATASNTGRVARKLDDVTQASGGEAISVASAA